MARFCWRHKVIEVASFLLLLLLTFLPTVNSKQNKSVKGSSLLPLQLLLRGGELFDNSSSSNYHHQQQPNQQVQQKYDFDRLSKLLQRLIALENVATDILLSFYDSESSTFATTWLPSDSNEVNNIYLKGAHSILQTTPAPSVFLLDGHACVSLVSVSNQFLAHGITNTGIDDCLDKDSTDCN